jgi:hypothetical protein
VWVRHIPAIRGPFGVGEGTSGTMVCQIIRTTMCQLISKTTDVLGELSAIRTEFHFGITSGSPVIRTESRRASDYVREADFL